MTDPLYHTLDCQQRRSSDETEHEKILFLMRHIRDGSSGNFLERQRAIVENRRPRYRVAAKTEVLA